jgi:hypothetical protein
VPSPTTFTYTNPTSGLPPSGGGFAVVSGQAAYGWLTSIFPGIGVVQENAFALSGIMITPQGQTAFPGLTSADLSTGPWHNYFTVPSTITVLTPLATAMNNAGQTVPLILTSIGATPTRPLIVTIDSTAPPAPLLPDLQDASDSFLPATGAPGSAPVGSNADDYTNVTSPSFTVGGIEPGTTVLLLRDGVVVPAVLGAAIPGAGGLLTLGLTDSGPVPAGTHTYQVRQLDLAGNLSLPGAALTVQVDISLPAIPSAPVLLPGAPPAGDDTGVVGDNVTNLPQPRLVGTVALTAGEAPATVQLIDANTGVVLGQAAAVPRPANPAVGDYAVTLNVAVPPGGIASFAVRARAVDLAGNLSPALSATYALTIDRRIPGGATPPTLALSPLDDSGLVGDNVTNVRQPTLIGRTGPNLRVDLQQLGVAAPLVVGVRTAADGSFQVRFPAPLADGTYLVRVRAYDLAGNEAFSPFLTLTIDTTAPAGAPGLRLADFSDTGVRGDGRTSLRRPLLVGAAGGPVEPGTRVEIIDPAGNVMNAPENPVNTRLRPDGTFETQTALELVNGTIVLRARLRDAAGNVGAVGGVPLVLTITTTEGDYNADGYADRAVYLQNGPTPGIGQWALAHTGPGLQVASFGASSDTPLRGDFDGDGADDLAVFRASTAEWFILNLPRGTFRAVQFGPAGASLPVPADYDGDGRTDLAVYVPATVPGTTSTWFVQGSRDGVTRATPFGGGGYQPVPGDYDNDGRSDIAVYLPASAASFAQWFVLGSRGGFAQVPFGGAGSQPVPADYDGDGASDIAVYQPASATSFAQWSVLGSRGGFQQTTFGGAGHVPVPQDYDNDGRADIAVYEPGTARWLLLTTSSGFGATQFGVAGSLAVPAPLPYRLAAPAPPAVRSLAAAPAPTAGSTVRAAAVAPAAPTAPAPAPAAGVSLNFGRTAVQLASRSARKAAPVRRRPPAQAADAPEGRPVRRRAPRPAARSRG